MFEPVQPSITLLLSFVAVSPWSPSSLSLSLSCRMSEPVQPSITLIIFCHCLFMFSFPHLSQSRLTRPDKCNLLSLSKPVQPSITLSLSLILFRTRKPTQMIYVNTTMTDRFSGITHTHSDNSTFSWENVQVTFVHREEVRIPLALAHHTTDNLASTGSSRDQNHNKKGLNSMHV